MKKIKLCLLCLFSLTLMAFSLSACGGDGTNNDGGDSTPPEPTKYSVVYSASNSSYGAISCKTQSGTTINSGDELEENTVIVFTAVENTGYVFEGYFLGAENKSAEKEYTLTLTSDVNVTGKFKAKSFAFNYSASNGGQISCDVTSGDQVNYATEVALTAVENVGYDFVGWFIGNSLVSESATYNYTIGLDDVSILAKFVPEKHALSFSVNNATMGNINCEQFTSGSQVDFGTEVTLTASANPGYEFEGWYLSGTKISSENQIVIEMPEYSHSLVAQFQKAKFALNFSVNDSDMGEISSDINSGELVEYLDSVELTAQEKTGYDFVEWLVGGESKGSNPTYTFQMPAGAVEIQAVFAPEKRTVTFYDGRDELKEQEVDFGTKINFEPTKLNYNFEGWYLESTLTTKFNVNNAITENLKLYAKWTAVPQSERQYEVNFVDHEGNPLNGWGTQLVQSGKYIKQIPNVPERVGYKFNNVWMRYDTAQGKYVNINNINTFQITQDVTITPKYDIITYTVKLYTNDVSYTSKTVEYGSKLAKPQTPTNSDATKVFDKWVYKDDTSMTFDFENTVITSDLQLKVAWKTVYTETVTVKFYNGNTTLDTQKIEKGSKATEPTPPEVANKTFAGWYLEPTFENEFDFATSITSNLDVYAKYVPKTYTVKFVDYDGREIESQTISHEQSATFPEQNPTRENYTFSGWSVSDLSNITSDLEVKAQYQINTFSVNFIGFGETEIDEQTIEHGKFATIPQVPEIEGYNFEGWYLDQEFEEKFSFSTSITSNLNVYAKYVQNVTEKYKVIFLDALGEILSEQSVLHGNSAIVPASPSKVGHDFAGWIVEFADDGNDYNNAVKDYTNVQAPLIVTPDFTKKAYTVRFFDKDGNQLGANVSVLYEELVKVEDIPYNLIPEIPDMIASWDKDVETFIITKDTDFTVKYTYEPCRVTFIIDGEELFTQVVDKGFYANIPNTPIKNYSIFDGWYLSGSDTEFNFSTETITEDITLYARFERTSYVISFIGYDGNPYGYGQIVKAGNKAIEPAPYEDETLNDYVWCLENETEEFDFINSTINEDIVLYAKLVNNSN